jgi:hypothetical protein
MMMAMTNNQEAQSQSGNVFLIILVGIVLFAALMFTFSRGVQQGTEGMAGREAELAASDIVTYGQQVQRGVERIIGRSISESDLSFANDADTNYVNPACADNRCLVFNPEGGAIKWKTPPSGVNFTSADYFISANRVASTDGMTDIGTDERDLVILLPVNANVCEAINGITSKLPIWSNVGTANTSTRFIGNYGASGGPVTISTGANSNLSPAGCFCAGALPCTQPKQAYYYQVLLTR